MEDVAVYGYVTPLKMKIIVAFALTDTIIKDAEVNLVSPLSPLFCYLILTANRFSRHYIWPIIQQSPILSST